MKYSSVVAYELWDIETGNLSGTYRSRAAALRDVADAVRRYGRSSPSARTLGLRRGRTEAVAHGESLIDMALAAEQAPAPHSATRKHRAA